MAVSCQYRDFITLLTVLTKNVCSMSGSGSPAWPSCAAMAFKKLTAGRFPAFSAA